MKEKYLNLMEKALSAYTNEQILNYFNDVQKNGLTEHGFSRLTSNIGILIAHGKRRDLTPLFLQMMDFCCCNIPKVKAANDFSVREVVNCIDALSKKLGCKVVEISALKEDGIFSAVDKAIEVAKEGKKTVRHIFSGAVEHAIAHIEEISVHNLEEDRQRWYAIKVFERDEKVIVLICDQKTGKIQEV